MQDTLALYQQTVDTLDKQAGSLFQEFSDQIQCRKGCAGCCIDGFKIRYIEGLNLLSGFSAVTPEIAVAILENLEKENSLACPLLVNGACALYAQRPSLCRAYGIILQLEDKIATCSLNFQNLQDLQPDQSLKSLDMKPYYDVIDEFSQQLWDIHPLPTLSEECKTPVFTIRQLFKAFLAFQQASDTPPPEASAPTPNLTVKKAS